MDFRVSGPSPRILSSPTPTMSHGILSSSCFISVKRYLEIRVLVFMDVILRTVRLFTLVKFLKKSRLQHSRDRLISVIYSLLLLTWGSFRVELKSDICRGLWLNTMPRKTLCVGKGLILAAQSGNRRCSQPPTVGRTMLWWFYTKPEIWGCLFPPSSPYRRYASPPGVPFSTSSVTVDKGTPCW